MSIFHKKERLFSVTSAGEIEKIVEDFQPDAYWLHSLTWTPNAFEKAMIKSGRPKVLTYHTLVEDYGRAYAGEIGAWRMRTRSRAVASAMDAVIVPSQVIAKRLSLYGVRKDVDVIPTGIKIPKTAYTKKELAERFHFPADSTVLLYVGRISREKNITKLIQLTQPLLQKNRAILLLVGPGDLIEVKHQAKKWAVGLQVICTGPLPKEDAQKIYGASDAFVFTSQTETQGLVIGEAMSAGLPVVALTSPIQPEIYPDEVAVVVRDRHQFANSIRSILDDDKRRLLMTTVAKKFVEENFSISGMISKQITLFERLIAGR